MIILGSRKKIIKRVVLSEGKRKNIQLGFILPEDIIIQILIKVPTASLLRFRSVSKQWSKLITERSFRNEHHKYWSTKENVDTKLIAFMTPAYYERLRSVYLPFEIHRVDVPNNISPPSNDVEHNIRGSSLSKAKNSNPVYILGSCYGILLLSHPRVRVLTLFNPTTREYKELPPRIQIDFPNAVAITDYGLVTDYGLGYDAVSEDYLVVAITSFRPCKAYVRYSYWPSQVQMYSLRTNSWQKFQDMPYVIEGISEPVFTNGALHWIVRRNNPENQLRHHYYTIAFDVAHKTFKEIPQPDYNEIRVSDLMMTEFDGYLCFTCYYIGGYTRAWIMRNYGVKSSWDVLFTTDYDNIPYFPICITKEGDFLLYRPRNSNRCQPPHWKKLGESKLVLYNPAHRRFKRLKVDNKRICVSSPTSFVQRLLSGKQAMILLSGKHR